MADTSTTGWPFWAPSNLEAVDTALDLAGLRPGERFVDLGCGDGQVLVAAARRGAEVLGVEVDEDLADEARAALEAHDLPGDVVVGDLLELGVVADVVFTYLAPGTLQRLTPALQACRGARLVTVDFAVPGLVPHRVAGATHLYRLPAPAAPPPAVAWPAAGVHVATCPDVASLTCLEAGHPAGPVTLEVSPELAAVATVRTGADELAEPGVLALDVRWEPCPDGTDAAGTIELAGVGALSVEVTFTADESRQGVWEW